MSHKKIITFILIAYGISWLTWLPNIISANTGKHNEINNWLHIVGGLGPMFSAFITILIFEKWAGFKKFISERFLKIPSARYILVGLTMPIILFIVSSIIIRVTTGEWVNLLELGINSKIPTENPVFIWLIWIIFYGIGEETGWRGFLLPELSKNIKTRISTLYTALIWAPWHIPVFFYDKDLGTMGVIGTLGWILGLIFGSIVLGWLAKSSKWNLIPVILWHGTFNFFTTSDRIDSMFASLMSMMTIAIAVWITRKYGTNLSKE
ncbi:CPBP family intramembrane metalloprotease [Candidatus Dojkabacteria bacterium]|nr:CPBP family intramembrane metalloprotease [Candidatus Dojkabacteria bacterium]